jgi:predicted nucleic acid-binding protein
VKSFLDTSVIVAAARSNDARYQASSALLHACRPNIGACAAHTLAEVYNNLTGTPPPNRLRPQLAMQFIARLSDKLECVALSPEEYLDAARGIADLGLLGGIIYDALLLACARKVHAERIYTWNVRHFRLVAPDLSDRIVQPPLP